MKAITTNVLFTVEGSECEVYEGTTRCRVSPATRDAYTAYGWVQGDPPEVEILDVVIYCVTVTVQGDACEAAADEYESFMCRGE